jgi:hypothetical protein
MSRGMRLEVQRHDRDSMLLPRPWSYFDGDGNNNHVAGFGINLNAECMDPLFGVGVEIRATPGSLVGRALAAVRHRAGR